MRRGAVALAAVCALTGCGKDGDEQGTALQRALGDVRDTASTRTFFEFGDTKALKELSGAKSAATSSSADPRWSRLLGSGFGILQASFGGANGAVDPYRADRALTAGQPGREAVRLDGPGVAKGNGDARIGLRVRRADGDDTVVFAASPDAADAVLDDGASLADVPEDAAAAGCLGDVISAEVLGGRLVSARTRLTTLAIGTRRPASAKAAATEVICAVARDGAAADAEVAALRKGYAPGAEYADAPIRGVVRRAEIGRADGSGRSIARAVLHLRAGRPAGFVLDQLRLFAVPGLSARR